MYQWKGAGGALKLDLVKRTSAITVARTDFPSVPANPTLVQFDLGGLVLTSEAPWTENAKKPGNVSLP